MKLDTLQRAMERLKQGDNSAFDTVYERTHKLVFFVIHQILKDVRLTEDIMQDTYVAAVKNIGIYTQNNPTAWLTTIAKRLAINEYNRRKRETVADLNVFADCLESDSRFPDEDSFGLIREAEKILDEIDFQIVVMCAISGYKRREAAAVMNMPVSTISYRYKHALETLKLKLKL